MTEHVNRQAVESKITRLREQYGPLYEEDVTVAVDAGTFQEEIVQSRAGYLGSAYAWIIREPDDTPALTESMPDEAQTEEPRVLLILGRGGTRWGIPGGGIEGEERVEETVHREVAEETSIRCTLDGCFGVRHERRTAPDADIVLHNIRAVFEGTYDAGSIAIQSGELAGAAWWRDRPSRIHPLAKPPAERWFDDEHHDSARD